MAGKLGRAVLLVAVIACDRDPVDLPASITLGTSNVETFEAIPPGGEIVAHRGPQGGFHVVLGLRATGLDPDAPTIDLAVTDLDLGRDLDRFAPLPLALTLTNDGDAYELRPRIVVLDIPSLDAIDGHRLRLAATVTDRRGVRVERALDAVCVRAE